MITNNLPKDFHFASDRSGNDGGGGAQALGGFNGSGFMSDYTKLAQINYSPSGGQTNYNGATGGFAEDPPG